jgi:arylsulfatase A-like enzyme
MLPDEGAEAGSSITTDDISNGSMRRAIAYTHAQVEMIDDGVGRLLEQLRLSGMDENTIVIFTSDHGQYFGNHGLLHNGPATYRQLTELYLLIKGIESRKQVSLTSHIDLAPTLLEMAGLAELAQADGNSMKPLLTGAVN